MQPNAVLGVDVGYSNLKAAWSIDPDSPIKLGRNARLLPSSARLADTLGRRVGAAQDGVMVSVGGRSYLACAAHNELVEARSMTQEYAFSERYRALLNAAICCSGYDVIEALITGLPVRQYQSEEQREKLRASLVGRWEVAPGREVEVRHAEVVAQPIGGFLDAIGGRGGGDWMLDSDVLVVDPGYYSLDWVCVSGGALIAENSGTSNRAMQHILRRTAESIAAGTGESCRLDRIEVALREKKPTVMFAGKLVEYRPHLERAVAEVVEPACQEVLNTLARNGERVAVERVVVVGGGADLYIPALQRIFGPDRVVSMPSPEMANARGYVAFGHELLGTRQ